MTTIGRINYWVTLAANIGVLAGILFLALEIRQSNRIAIATTEIGVRTNYAALNESIFSNRDVAELLTRAYTPASDFTPADTEMLWAYVGWHVNQWFSVETAYDNGMVPKTTFEMVMNDIDVFVDSYPASAPILHETFEIYPAMKDTKIHRAVEQALSTLDN